MQIIADEIENFNNGGDQSKSQISKSRTMHSQTVKGFHNHPHYDAIIKLLAVSVTDEEDDENVEKLNDHPRLI